MQNSENSKQPVLIVAGMHRSGTSLTAALLQSAGVDVGQRLLDASPSNLAGHFENLDFLDFHQAVLRSTGTSDAGWSLNKIDAPEHYIDVARALIAQNASSSKPWGWKDPRTVLFLDFWSNLIPEAKFIFVYRSPWEVVDSLYRRGDAIFHHNPQLALDLWLNYNQIILEFYNRFPNKCVLAHLRHVTNNPAAFIDLLNRRLELSLNAPKDDIYNASLLNNDSNSHRATLIRRYLPDAYALYQQLNCTAEFSDDSASINHTLASPNAWLLKDWLELRLLEKSFSNEVTHLQNQLSFSQAESTKAIQEKQQLQGEKQQLQDEKQQLQSEKQQLQDEKQQLQGEKQQLQGEKQQLQGDFYQLLDSKNQLKDQFQDQLEHVQAEVNAMKTSKFWKLRSQWFKLKTLLNVKE